MGNFIDSSRSRWTATSLGLLAMLSFASAAKADGVAIHSMPMIASPGSLPRAIAVRANSNSNANSSSNYSSNVPAPVLDALAQATPFPSAELRGSHYRASGHCIAQSAELTSPIVASGETSLRIIGTDGRGKDCTVYAFLDVRVTGEVLVATRPIREGAPLEGSVRLVRREIERGEAPLTSIPDGVLASRSLSMGQLIESTHLRDPNLNPGSPIRVRVQTGALSLEEEGHVARCPNPGDGERACAIVVTGKRVEGIYRDGALLVESP